jgi:hypothetical protein
MKRGSQITDVGEGTAAKPCFDQCKLSFRDVDRSEAIRQQETLSRTVTKASLHGLAQ